MTNRNQTRWHNLDFLKTKKAYVLLYKTNGTRESYIWKADRIKSSSSVNKNLRSGYLRKWKEKNIFRAEDSTDINDLPQFNLMHRN